MAAIWPTTGSDPIILNPAGIEFSFVNGICDLYQAGDIAIWPVMHHAARWSGSATSYVDLNPPGFGLSGAYGIALGASEEPETIVGWASNSPLNDPMYGCHAGLWIGGDPQSFVDLQPPTADTSVAFAAFAHNQVGYSRINSLLHASLWSGTAASWVDLHPTGYDTSSAQGISSTNQVGWASVAGNQHAGLWTGTPGSWMELHPTGARASYANATSGPIQVGAVAVGRYFHAALWTGEPDTWIDLHKLIPAGYVQSYAKAVYTDGVTFTVVGYAETPEVVGTSTAFVWTGPVPDHSFGLSLNKIAVAGQNYVMGTITMGQVRAAITTFATYDDSSLVTTPSTVSVPIGLLTKNFQIQTTAITSTINVTIYAKKGSVVHSQPLTLLPLVPTAVVCSPNPVKGGDPTTCRIVVNGVAGAGGRTIAILDNSPYAAAPTTVTIPAGGTDVKFPVQTMPVTTVKSVTITARVSAGEKTGTFRITP